MSLKPSAASVVAQDKRRRHQTRRRWIIIPCVIVGLVLFGFFGLPPIIRAQAIKHLSAALHREVTIEKIRINPLVLSVSIEGLAIKDRDGRPFTSWQRVYVNFDSFSLFTGEWRFQEITLDHFQQRVVLAQDGTFNFSDLIPPATTESAAPAAESSPARPIRIKQLSVNSSALSFTDASRAQTFATEVGPLTFALTNFVTSGDPKAPYEFSATTELGETFSWKGTVGIDPVRSSGQFSVGKLALKKYAPYYADQINADLLDGVLNFSGRYSIDLGAETRQLTLTDASVTLSKLQVAARGTTLPLIDLPSLAIEGISADGVKPAATISRIALTGGRLTVVREKDGSINLLNLLTPPSAKLVPALPPSVAMASATSPAPALPDVKLDEFLLSGLAIDVLDRTTPTLARNSIGRLDMGLKNFSLAEPAAPVAFKIAAATVPSGTIEIEGAATREPLSADVAVKVTSLPLAGATPYIEPFLNLKIAGGAVSVTAKAGLTGDVARFQGDVVIDKFATVDGAKAEDFVGFSQLAILGIDALSKPLTAKVGEIRLTDPAARVVVNTDQTTNLETILRKASASETSPVVSLPSTAPAVASAPEVASAGPDWSLGQFTLINGSATLYDRSVKPNARIALDQFNGTVKGLTSADLQRGDVDIRGKLNGSGLIKFTGKLDAKAATLTPGALTEISVDVKGVDLSPISPYIGTYAGYELARSGLTVDVKASLTERKLDTANVVTLNQFTLGAPTNSPLATKLPVRLGVALLKDIDGNIVINLPVKGSLDDPEFKIGRVVIRVVVNLLTKAATSPFSLIGSMFGGGGDELAYQDFAPGAIVPQESEYKKLDTLRMALKSRPALNLDITGSFDPVADQAQLREQKLNQQIRYRLWEELRESDPNVPPPAELTLSVEDEARAIGLLVAERYPQGLSPIAPDGSVNIVVPLVSYNQIAPEPKQPKQDTPTSSQIYVKGAVAPRGAPPKKSTLKPVPIAVGESSTPSTPGAPAPLTLADARRALLAGIKVGDEDLLLLAGIRGQQIRDALLADGSIAPERLFLTPPTTEGKGAKVLLQLR